MYVMWNWDRIFLFYLQRLLEKRVEVLLTNFLPVYVLYVSMKLSTFLPCFDKHVPVHFPLFARAELALSTRAWLIKKTVWNIAQWTYIAWLKLNFSYDIVIIVFWQVICTKCVPLKLEIVRSRYFVYANYINYFAAHANINAV